jgi:hypothetical protein
MSSRKLFKVLLLFTAEVNEIMAAIPDKQEEYADLMKLLQNVEPPKAKKISATNAHTLLLQLIDHNTTVVNNAFTLQSRLLQGQQQLAFRALEFQERYMPKRKDT